MGGVGRIYFQTNSVVSFDKLRDTKRIEWSIKLVCLERKVGLGLHGSLFRKCLGKKWVGV